jgi:hypothetical protein
MNIKEQAHFLTSISKGQRILAGLVLVAMGVSFYIDQILKTGWLSLVILPCLGILLLLMGMYNEHLKLIIPGGIFTGLGLGSYLAMHIWLGHSISNRLGIFLLGFGLGWLLITILSIRIKDRTAWWALIPGGVLASLGAFFLNTDLRPVDLAFYVGLGVGFSLLIWGSSSRLFGLIIPGCLVLGIGTGVYFAWGRQIEANELAQIGILLVTFAFSWGLITLFSRLVIERYIWWPLIPGSLLAMVGWGLYIGGNPGNALSFIGNTGSLGLIIFGLYLLLWRRGIHR